MIVSVGDPVDDHKPHKHASEIPRARYFGFAVPVGKGEEYELSEWPERHERKREWYRVAQAAELLSWRPDAATLLRRASEAGLLKA